VDENKEDRQRASSEALTEEEEAAIAEGIKAKRNLNV
jgi:hypothetical protein